MPRAPFDVFFFQAEDGIRDIGVTGVQTCALPISPHGNVQDWLQGIRCFHSQRSAADDCGSEPNPDQNDWWHHDLYQRWRVGPRWLSPADQYRARQWAALGIAEDPKSGERVKADRDFGHQGPSSSN